MKMISFFIFSSNEAPVEWNWQGKTEVFREERNLSQCHFVHHKSHMDWPRDRNRASAVGGRRLTAWAMARPTGCLGISFVLNSPVLPQFICIKIFRYNWTKFDAVTAVLLKIKVFWDVTLCRLVNIYWRLEGFWCLLSSGSRSQSSLLGRSDLQLYLNVHFIRNPLSKTVVFCR
jgi:hypothetical protein